MINQFRKSAVNGPCDICGELIRINDMYAKIRRQASYHRICLTCNRKYERNR